MSQAENEGHQSEEQQTGDNGGAAQGGNSARGFAAMDNQKQREIASKGGRAAHEKGTAHEWTADEARNAGRKGGQVSRGGRGRLVIPTGDPSGVAAIAANDDASAGDRMAADRAE